MNYPAAGESSATKILQFLEYFASRGFREFEVSTSTGTEPGQVGERRSWEVSEDTELAMVAREVVLYARLFP
jgi:hypothetical protein